jgi:dolichol-phosphate mannosyltransferase
MGKNEPNFGQTDNAMISLVIPTYREVDAIQPALRRAAAALAPTGEEFELIVVDDFRGDDTAERAEALAGELPVRVLRRSGRQGLATAVVDGWRAARGGVWGVMDADLQHPPEVLAELVEALRRPGIDLAVASRYVAGGRSRKWPWRRQVISWLTTHLAASALPWTLGAIHDPMSGMFLVRAEVLRGIELQPLGYKILLEVLARGRWRAFTEVPYRFRPRAQGESKLGTRQSIEYVLHLARLARVTGQMRTWMRYATVGLSGALLDVGLFRLLVLNAGWAPLAALPVAIEIALLSNFIWNQELTFRRSPPLRLPAAAAPGEARPSALRSLARYQKACLAGAGLNALTTLGALAHGAAPMVAAAAGVLAGGVWNLIFNVPRIWQAWAVDGHSSPAEAEPTKDGRLQPSAAGTAAGPAVKKV